MTRSERDELARILKNLCLTRDMATVAIDELEELLNAVNRELEAEDNVNDALERIARGTTE
jgi:hypothetical protein